MTSNQRPLVSIIIPHTAGTEILIDCLEAVGKGADEHSSEIILVDNASSDGSVAAAKQQFPEIRVLTLDSNQGYAGGCNRGIEVADGKYIVLLNDDTKVDPDCLSELVRTAEADPNLGACQPKVRAMRDPSHFEYSGAAGGLMDVYGYPFSRGRLMDHVEEDVGQFDEPAEVFWASGVCMLIRKSVLDEVGAFDETFFAYMEEIDLSWRIQLGGFHVVYVPSAVVYHIGGFSLERKSVRRMFLNHRNSLIMLAKNYSGRSLLWIFPVKVVLEVFIFAGALLKNPRRSQAVVLAFGWMLIHVPTVARLRAKVQARRVVSDEVILSRLYRGMAPIWYFLFGIRQMTDLPDIDRILHQPYRVGEPSDRTGTIQPRRRNFLYAYLDQAPVALALMRAVECDHLSALPFERPILDIGCGDGTFARILFNGVTVDAGIDRDEKEIARAKLTNIYDDLRTGEVQALPYESERFATVYSNCVLEHIPDIENALREIERVLKPGGALYITVPNPRCVTFLWWRDKFRKLGLTSLAEWYGNLTLRLFNAEHVLEAEGWSELFERVGLETEHHEPYMPLRASRVQDLLLPTAFLSVILKALIERKLLFPRFHRVKVRSYRSLFKGIYVERAPEGSATMLVARKPRVGRN
jgi:GT2 family glycosyltransferase/SAM-dependent methyltransferase